MEELVNRFGYGLTASWGLACDKSESTGHECEVVAVQATEGIEGEAEILLKSAVTG